MAMFKLRNKRLLKLEIVQCLAWARLLVKFVPFRWWRATLGPLGQPDAPAAALLPQQVATAVSLGRMIARIADRMPFEAVCLPRAMACRWMLARRRIPTRLVIGSRRGEEGEAALLYHAWLLAGSCVVTGQGEARRHHAYRAGEPAAD